MNYLLQNAFFPHLTSNHVFIFQSAILFCLFELGSLALHALILLLWERTWKGVANYKISFILGAIFSF